MSTIKKAFLPVHNVLTANRAATVESILPELEALMSAKQGGGGSRANTYLMFDGEPVGVFCYYHKAWFSPEHTEFGQKKNTATGLNNMTTHGLSCWNKQQSEYNKAKDAALSDFQADVIDANKLKDRMAQAEEARTVITSHPDGGFSTLAELVAHYGYDVDADQVAAIDQSRQAALDAE